MMELSDLEEKYFDDIGETLCREMEQGKVKLRFSYYILHDVTWDSYPRYEIHFVDATGLIRLVFNFNVRKNIKDLKNTYDLYFLSHKYFRFSLPEDIKTRVRSVISLADRSIRQPKDVETNITLHPSEYASEADIASLKRKGKWWTISEIDMAHSSVTVTSQDWEVCYKVYGDKISKVEIYANLGEVGSEKIGAGEGFFEALDNQVLRVFKALKTV